MLNALERAQTFGSDTKLGECIRQFQIRQKRPGICVIISDFLAQESLKDDLACLQWSRNDIYCLQTLDKDEIRCDIRGDVELQCVETGATRRVTISMLEAKRFEEAFANWNEELKNDCAKIGVGFSSTTNETPFEEVIQGILRRGGLVS